MRITCACGRSLVVRDELAGKRVKCPGCGEILTVAQPGPAKAKPAARATPEEAAPGPKAAPAAPGKARRPTGEDDVQTAAKKTPPPKARPRDDEDEEDDRPRRKRDRDEEADRPRRKKAKPAGMPVWARWLILGGVGVAGLVAALVVAFIVLGPKKPPVEDNRTPSAGGGQAPAPGAQGTGPATAPKPVDPPKENIVQTLKKAGIKASSGMIDPNQPMVEITPNNLTAEGLIKPEVFQQLKGVKAFDRLAFEGPNYQVGSPISDAGLAQLKDLGDCLNIVLQGAARITDGGLSNLVGKQGLKQLNLSRTNITGEGLANFKGLPQLKQLTLHDCKHFSDAGIASLAGLPALEELFMKATPLSEGGARRLGQIHTLRRLSLGAQYAPDTPPSAGQLTDAGMAALGGLTTLETLDLAGGCRAVSDAGLAGLEGLTKLTQLRLGPCPRVTGAGLSNLKGLTKLEDLNLDNAAVADKDLGQLEPLQSLTSLSLKNTKVTKAGIGKLKTALPKLRDVYVSG
jgi:hypothetical protein